MATGIVDLSPIERYLDTVSEKYVYKGLTYGWKSNSKKEYDFGHWNNLILRNSRIMRYDHGQMEFIEAHPEVKLIWNELQTIIGPRALVRVYVNAYTYGTDAYFHRDDQWLTDALGKESQSETIIVYLNKEWDIDWGGETALLNEDDTFMASVFPARNRAFIFDSYTRHSARSITRACPHLRSILVFKTAQLDKYNHPVVEELKKMSDDVDHSGSNLFSHLYQTAQLVEQAKGSVDMVWAALFHSIYGTEFYDCPIEITRDKVKEMIGEKAENLAHIFCTTKDRFNTFVQNTENYDMETRYGLMLIELANLTEQAARRPVNQEKIQRLHQEISRYETSLK